MSAPDEIALDMLAAALAPRVLRLLREQVGPCDDDGLAALLAGSGFEIDDSVAPAPKGDGRTARPKRARAA